MQKKKRGGGVNKRIEAREETQAQINKECLIEPMAWAEQKHFCTIFRYTMQKFFSVSTDNLFE